MSSSFENAMAHFRASYMSNTKWEKLLHVLTEELGEVHFEYKLVYNEEVKQSSLDAPDFPPFFIEPIEYREVEWVEFPDVYEDFVSYDNLKAGKKDYSQDINRIEEVIRSLGQFPLERLEGSLKLYAYR